MSVFKLEKHLGSNLFPSIKVSGFGRFSGYPYCLSSNDEEYLTATSAAEMTLRWSDCTASVLAAARLYLSPLVEAPTNWGQVNAYLKDSHTDCMEIDHALWLPDITNWWSQQEEMHSKYIDFSCVACGIFSIIPHCDRAEARFPLRETVSARDSK